MKIKKFDARPSTYSVSRLKTYNRCSYEYYHKYVLNTPVERKSSASTVLGSIIHYYLDHLYSCDDDNIDSLLDVIKIEAANSMVFAGACKGLQLDEVETFATLCLEYANDISSLYERASASYTGSDAIRVKGGGVASNPAMTSDWKKAEAELDLPGRRQVLDDFIFDKVNEAPDYSLVSTFSEAYFLCKKYKTPPQLRKILYLEMPISHWSEADRGLQNPVLMPSAYGGKNKVYLNGYIDLVAEVDIGKGNQLAIIDHKTDKSSYTEDEMACNRQLMAYVYAYESLFKEKVEVIGINNIRSNTLVTAPLNRDHMKEALDSLFSTHIS